MQQNATSFQNVAAICAEMPIVLKMIHQTQQIRQFYHLDAKFKIGKTITYSV